MLVCPRPTGTAVSGAGAAIPEIARPERLIRERLARPRYSFDSLPPQAYSGKSSSAIPFKDAAYRVALHVMMPAPAAIPPKQERPSLVDSFALKTRSPVPDSTSNGSMLSRFQRRLALTSAPYHTSSVLQRFSTPKARYHREGHQEHIRSPPRLCAPPRCRKPMLYAPRELGIRRRSAVKKVLLLDACAQFPAPTSTPDPPQHQFGRFLRESIESLLIREPATDDSDQRPIRGSCENPNKSSSSACTTPFSDQIIAEYLDRDALSSFSGFHRRASPPPLKFHQPVRSGSSPRHQSVSIIPAPSNLSAIFPDDGRQIIRINQSAIRRFTSEKTQSHPDGKTPCECLARPAHLG